MTGPELALDAAAIKREAGRLGFQTVGIASADRFAEAEAFLLQWVRAGRHGEMAWIDEERVRHSCRPDQLLPGARSIVVVGATYSRDPETPAPPLHGRVARYARGADYHDVLTARLRDLGAFMQREASDKVRWRIFVDSAPLVEREAAVRAGLGFYGKNTCLLTAGAGSWLLLGALLTDLALEPDRVAPRDCGSCRLCLDACPTGALTGPYQLDARRCLSYLTIELRGPIPVELRPALGDHLFGCDVCQEVCPWNHGHGPLPLPALAPRAEIGADLELTELLALDEAGFRERFRGSPLKRAKRRGLLRNAAVVLGNSGDRRAVPTLSRALADDPESLVRAHAAWALRRLGGPLAEAALTAAREREQDPAVLAEIGPITPS